jgi:hypothetical protein
MGYGGGRLVLLKFETIVFFGKIKKIIKKIKFCPMRGSISAAQLTELLRWCDALRPAGL